jgi:hypothetical protein
MAMISNCVILLKIFATLMMPREISKLLGLSKSTQLQWILMANQKLKLKPPQPLKILTPIKQMNMELI